MDHDDVFFSFLSLRPFDFVFFRSRAGTYDNVKGLVSAGAIPLLLDAARAFEEDSATLSAVYLALKQLAANDESVKLVSYIVFFCCIDMIDYAVCDRL